mgnify:CR=1 FL=1
MGGLGRQISDGKSLPAEAQVGTPDARFHTVQTPTARIGTVASFLVVRTLPHESPSSEYKKIMISGITCYGGA